MQTTYYATDGNPKEIRQWQRALSEMPISKQMFDEAEQEWIWTDQASPAGVLGEDGPTIEDLASRIQGLLESGTEADLNEIKQRLPEMNIPNDNAEGISQAIYALLKQEQDALDHQN